MEGSSRGIVWFHPGRRDQNGLSLPLPVYRLEILRDTAHKRPPLDGPAVPAPAANKKAIAAAKKHLAGGKKIKASRGYKGATRQHIKTVAEMKKNRKAATANASEADKAKLRAKR
jgi:hypothetical protein